ncbi:MAG: protein translocase subunit SecF, partial [Dehalococcoidia bacterium]
MFDIISKKFRFFAISGVLILICIISLSSLGLKAGIEFSGGSQLTLSFSEDVKIGELKLELDNLGYGNAIVQQALGSGDFLVRTFELSSSEEAQLVNELAVIFGPLDSRSDDISPITARETTNITTVAIAIAAVGIMLYVTWAFRRMPKPFRYGTCAIIALLHDTLIAL